MTSNVTNKTIGTANISRLLVQTDSKADTIYFYLTKTHDTVDISGYTWYLSYENESGEGDTVLLTKTLSTTTFTLAWQPSGYATSRDGRLRFNIYGIQGADVKWNSFPAYIDVRGSVDATTTGGFTNPLLDQYLVLFEDARDRAEAAADSAEEDLATFQSIWLGALSADPVATVNGAIYFNTTTTRLRIYVLATTTWHDYGTDADEIDYTPSGQLIAITVQAAIDELEEEKEPAANKTTIWAETPGDVKFPTEALVDARFTSIESVIGHIFATDYRVSDGVCARALDSVGKTFAVHAGAYDSSLVNDFDNCAPWKDIKQIKTDANGVLLAVFGDGVYDTLTTAEMYTRYSEYWLSIKPITINSVAYVRWAVSDVPRVGFFKAPMFANGDGTYNKYLYLGRGQASEESGALVTKPWLAHSRSRTLPTYLSMAAAKGDGKWGLYDYATMMSIYTLMVVEAGKMDVKSAYGQGIQSGMPYSASIVCTLAQTGANSIIIATTQATNFYVGMMAQIGSAYTSQNIAANRYITLIEDMGDGNTRITVDGAAFNTALGNTIACWDQPVPLAQIDALHGGSGYITQFNSVYRSHVCYRGAWDLWGNLWQFVAGFYRKDMAVYVCFDPSKYTVTDPTLDAAWIYLGTPNLTDGYQKTWTFVDTPYGMAGYPSATGGGAGSGTFYAAFLYYFNGTYMGVRVLRSGGSWYRGDTVSPLYWHGNYSLSDTSIDVGARLIRRVAA